MTTKQSPDTTAIWEAFNRTVFAAYAEHMPHDPAAYERARAIAQARAHRAVDELRAATDEPRRGSWRQPRSLIPFDSDIA